jgi:hypothetical protein
MDLEQETKKGRNNSSKLLINAKMFLWSLMLAGGIWGTGVLSKEVWKDQQMEKRITSNYERCVQEYADVDSNGIIDREEVKGLNYKILEGKGVIYKENLFNRSFPILIGQEINYTESGESVPKKVLGEWIEEYMEKQK